MEKMHRRNYIYPYPLGLGASGDMEFAYNLGRVTAIKAKKDGVNVVWSRLLILPLRIQYVGEASLYRNLQKFVF